LKFLRFETATSYCCSPSPEPDGVAAAPASSEELFFLLFALSSALSSALLLDLSAGLSADLSADLSALSLLFVELPLPAASLLPAEPEPEPD
jgi:hypothetical protein